MPAPPAYASSMQNLKTVAEKIKWRVQYQERVAEQRFQARVVLTPPGADSVELAWCASADTKKRARAHDDICGGGATRKQRSASRTIIVVVAVSSNGSFWVSNRPKRAPVADPRRHAW